MPQLGFSPSSRCSREGKNYRASTQTTTSRPWVTHLPPTPTHCTPLPELWTEKHTEHVTCLLKILLGLPRTLIEWKLLKAGSSICTGIPKPIKLPQLTVVTTDLASLRTSLQSQDHAMVAASKSVPIILASWYTRLYVAPTLLKKQV